MNMGSGVGTVLALAGFMTAVPAHAEVSASPDETTPMLPGIPRAAILLPTLSPPAPVVPVDALVGVEPMTWSLAQLSANGDAPNASAEIAALAAAVPSDAPGIIDSRNVVGEQPTGDDSATIAGPAEPRALRWSDHIPRDQAAYRGFWAQAGTVKTEVLVGLAYFTLISSHKFFEDTAPFHFKNEGWFGKDTENIGVDKLTHAFDTYLLAEFFHSRIHERTGASQGDAVTGAIIASGLMAFNEISDAIEPDSGYSLQDVTMNIAGATLSVLRNTIPGMKEKFSFKVEVVPDKNVYSIQGKSHYAQQRFMFSLKGAGFEKLHNTPLRFLDLQLGYFATDFSNADKAAGVDPKRHIFVGVGLNLGELLFSGSRSRLGKAAYTVLDYFQIPYTSVRYDTTGRFDF
ncbi:DUF2279 domain-containing protein [Novosphingobium sp. BL-8A]|uniref:DUF2279 domain-containing protein n=1 Tax=Novosphingobium sp. BL-8A TaxID=3127639 RepID=UPI003756498E